LIGGVFLLGEGFQPGLDLFKVDRFSMLSQKNIDDFLLLVIVNELLIESLASFETMVN
jgi:hypothetical protein